MISSLGKDIKAEIYPAAALDPVAPPLAARAMARKSMA